MHLSNKNSFDLVYHLQLRRYSWTGYNWAALHLFGSKNRDCSMTEIGYLEPSCFGSQITPGQGHLKAQSIHIFNVTIK